VTTSRHVRSPHITGDARHTMFPRDKELHVRDGEVIIIDESPPQIRAGAIPKAASGAGSKEHQPGQPENQTLASITSQKLFPEYEKLAGMTGKPRPEADEVRHLQARGRWKSRPRAVAEPRGGRTRLSHADGKYRRHPGAVERANARRQPCGSAPPSTKNPKCSRVFENARLQQIDSATKRRWKSFPTRRARASPAKLFAGLERALHEPEAYIVAEPACPARSRRHQHGRPRTDISSAARPKCASSTRPPILPTRPRRPPG